MEQIILSKEVTLSRVIHGLWRLKDWKMTREQLLLFVQQAMDMGVTSFDHADIYGNHECEAMFGEALALQPALRNKMQLISKCGIMLTTDKNPDRKVKHYDYSKAHIIKSVEQSLINLKTDFLDVLLLHRPSPFFDVAEVAEAFEILKKQGKVLAFGVSNFNQTQYELLDNYLTEKLVTNQIEISANCLEHFENNNLDFLQMKKVSPMAWSPLGGGNIFNPSNEKDERVAQAIKNLGEELGVGEPDKLMYAWLFKHPSRIMAIAGTGKIERLRTAVDALDIDMSLEQWFGVYIAARGKQMP